MAWYHQWTARLLSAFPELYEKITLKFAGSIPADFPESPWERLDKDPFTARLMFITTGGVHTPDQQPFDMSNSQGDNSYRWIPTNLERYEITHDYYDHSDADTDINCLFPIPLARRLSQSGLIGPLVNRHLSFMGHIEDPLIPELINDRLPAMWDQLEDRPDLVLLSPG